ncbi:hypothetical protein HYH02_007532 [Chlamydomonas schloesseri]|uniref:Fungal lipase-type domain-containing protein n=1 Tax=Chlamydomonas schloesseri TaxID=2026947 RepID=A0A835WHG9_9CHLO|nr:hypothetical protein HYH02_007532 [Chlamydomonas schloesseri]|eukprot:KAG2447612.1 hypothetical protein HYH02_007532 [Chlamydomonas schloesseri]
MQTGYWIRNSGCLSSSYCSSNGWCESASTWTTTRGCGSSSTVSTRESASSSCRSNGCGYGGCNSNEIEVSSSWCYWPPSYNERCCTKVITSTCRDWLACSWVQNPNPPPPEPRRSPPPPPPRASSNSGGSSSGGSATAVFSSGGAWDAYASSNKGTNAYIAAILANHAYADSVGASRTNLDDWSTKSWAKVGTPMGAERASYAFGNEGAAWIVYETRDTVFVAMRGTEPSDANDVANDLDVSWANAHSYFGNNAYIMQGWYTVFTANVRFFKQEYDKFITGGARSKKLWFTGHSLGGVMATLFAAYMQRNGYSVQGVYTFGSPIVGDEDWKDAYPLVITKCSAANRRRQMQQVIPSNRSSADSTNSSSSYEAELCGYSTTLERNGTTVTAHTYNCTEPAPAKRTAAPPKNATLPSSSTSSSSNTTSSSGDATDGGLAELGALDALDALDAPTAAPEDSQQPTVNATTADGTTAARAFYITNPLYTFFAVKNTAGGAHYMSDSYMKIIYFCYLSSSERARVPSWSWANRP